MYTPVHHEGSSSKGYTGDTNWKSVSTKESTSRIEDVTTSNNRKHSKCETSTIERMCLSFIGFTFIVKRHLLPLITPSTAFGPQKQVLVNLMERFNWSEVLHRSTPKLMFPWEKNTCGRQLHSFSTKIRYLRWHRSRGSFNFSTLVRSRNRNSSADYDRLLSWRLMTQCRMNGSSLRCLAQKWLFYLIVWKSIKYLSTLFS